MSLRRWWTGLTRAYQNLIALLLANTVIFLGALLRIKPFHSTWDALTYSLPNVYEPLALQIVSLVRDASPGAVVVPSVALVYGTLFLSVLTIHAVTAVGVGFLFDFSPRGKAWGTVNAFTLVFVLFALHYIFLLAAPLP